MNIISTNFSCAINFRQMKWDYIVVSFLYIITANSCIMENKSKNSQSISQKPFFHIAFQEGFYEDEVHVVCNGESIYQNGNITSDVRIGLADSFEIPQQEGPNKFDFMIPKKDIKQSITFQFSSTVYIAVSYINDELKLTISDQPFGYM